MLNGRLSCILTDTRFFNGLVLHHAVSKREYRGRGGEREGGHKKIFTEYHCIINYIGCRVILCIDQFTTRHKVVHNGGSPNFEGFLFDKNKTYMAQILQSLGYKVCSITLPNLNTFGLFIPILGRSTIMDQTGCCYNVTTSETGLYCNY